MYLLYFLSQIIVYCSDRFLPDKAIDPIDKAGSRVQLQHAHCNENQMDQPSVCRKRNSKLKAIPELLNDLQIIYKMKLKAEVKDDLLDSSKEESQGNSNGHQSSQEVLPVFNQDLNYRPLDENTTELIDKKTNIESLPGSESVFS
ncbi:hypothetical protein HN51_054654 [Arachis hypogaea]